MARALHRRRLIGQRMPALYANVKKAQATRLASEKSEPSINRACLCRVAREKDMTKLSEKSQELAAAGLGVSMKQRAAVSRIRRDSTGRRPAHRLPTRQIPDVACANRIP